MSEVQLEVQARTEFGTNATRRLRKTNQVPFVVYAAGKGAELRLSVDWFALKKVFESVEFRTGTVVLLEGKKKHEVTLKSFARNPASDKIQHLDFERAAVKK